MSKKKKDKKAQCLCELDTPKLNIKSNCPASKAVNIKVTSVSILSTGGYGIAYDKIK